MAAPGVGRGRLRDSCGGADRRILVSTSGSAQAIATAVPLATAQSFAVLAGGGVC